MSSPTLQNGPGSLKDFPGGSIKGHEFSLLVWAENWGPHLVGRIGEELQDLLSANGDEINDKT
jgi:hypothetical protein